ncbi:hypothetical protein DM02DRAFT_663407 [Periconia macrospinosa]|uniref:Uncharacterized protein n=1 Tax=Periconia macrospinosa TaxID=97972 RepID=A0A2V1D1R7_9PLEO|nr:hypothetical protein DM02DRAFT_663407 [Periconia macrospinosa]
MSKSRTTKLVDGYCSDIPFFWFVQAGEEQRQSTVSALNDILKQHTTDKPDCDQKREISKMKQDMGATADEIIIHNWPHEAPASQAETYNLFRKYPGHFIATSGLPVGATRPDSAEFMVYILYTVFPGELRKLRRIIGDKNHSVYRAQYCPEYRVVADPPGMFVFLDNNALDKILGSQSGYDHVPLASLHVHFTVGAGVDLVGEEMPAYLYTNVTILEGLSSTLANVGTGNMEFEEVALLFIDSVEAVFGPEYRGSMTREIFF